jgi:predicted ATPase
VLVISRTALNLRGEQQVPLRPLAVRATVGGQTAPAVELFAERAQAVAADLAGPAARDAAVGICARLDGLPLAIELAAARVRHLPLTRCETSSPTGSGCLSAVPSTCRKRQRTVRDTVAWSHDLLGPAQAKLFRRLLVFSGGHHEGQPESANEAPSSEVKHLALAQASFSASTYT